MFGGQTSHCLLYQLGRLFKSSSLKDGTLIDLLSNIYPRYPKPKKKGKKIPQKILNLLSTTLKPIWDTEKKWDMDSEIIRLLDCMKFNSIGVYQNNEQFGYSSRYEKFNSSCLYPPVVSLFNHRWEFFAYIVNFIALPAADQTSIEYSMVLLFCSAPRWMSQFLSLSAFHTSNRSPLSRTERCEGTCCLKIGTSSAIAIGVRGREMKRM